MSENKQGLCDLACRVLVHKKVRNLNYINRVEGSPPFFWEEIENVVKPTLEEGYLHYRAQIEKARKDGYQYTNKGVSGYMIRHNGSCIHDELMFMLCMFSA